MIEIPRQFFVVGTSTEVGKSLVSAMFMSALEASYWKPIQCGMFEETDSEFVQRIAEVESSQIIPEKWTLNSPTNPLEASEIDGVSISIEDFSVPEYSTRHLVVEGTGGVLDPINREQNNVDLIKKLNLPVLLVSNSGKETVNHTLLSLNTLKDAGVRVFAVLLSGEYNDSNREIIRRLGEVSVYELGTILKPSRQDLITAFDQLVSLGA